MRLRYLKKSNAHRVQPANSTQKAYDIEREPSQQKPAAPNWHRFFPAVWVLDGASTWEAWQTNSAMKIFNVHWKSRRERIDWRSTLADIWFGCSPQLSSAWHLFALNLSPTTGTSAFKHTGRIKNTLYLPTVEGCWGQGAAWQGAGEVMEHNQIAFLCPVQQVKPRTLTHTINDV